MILLAFGIVAKYKVEEEQFQFNFAHCDVRCRLLVSLKRSLCNSKREKDPPVFSLILTQYISDFIIISFRWDYLQHFQARGGRFPGFDNFRRGGVETEYLQSVFPSESFPAWQTINTGLCLFCCFSRFSMVLNPTDCAYKHDFCFC